MNDSDSVIRSWAVLGVWRRGPALGAMRPKVLFMLCVMRLTPLAVAPAAGPGHSNPVSPKQGPPRPGEVFHVPKPAAVVFAERRDKGEHFRSGRAWQVGKGSGCYFRPSHETFPVLQQAEPLRAVENAARGVAPKRGL